MGSVMVRAGVDHERYRMDPICGVFGPQLQPSIAGPQQTGFGVPLRVSLLYDVLYWIMYTDRDFDTQWPYWRTRRDACPILNFDWWKSWLGRRGHVKVDYCNADSALT